MNIGLSFKKIILLSISKQIVSENYVIIFLFSYTTMQNICLIGTYCYFKYVVIIILIEPYLQISLIYVFIYCHFLSQCGFCQMVVSGDAEDESRRHELPVQAHHRPHHPTSQ